mgnify:CR=1 FL=1|tara:strand:- start:6 stop:680 length:675 start_codon:yes stop_codon:yes gene_type:complete
MAQFGWAYVNCSSSSGGSAVGPTGSVQFLTGAGNTSGSANFMWFTASDAPYVANTLLVKGTLHVSGAITASHYHIENVTQIDVSGSTFMGNTNDDRHVRTGSLEVVQADGTPLLHVTNSNGMVNVRGFAGRYTIVSSATATASIPSYIVGVRHTSNVEILIPSASTYGSGAILVVKDEVSDRGGTNIRLTASVGYLIDNTVEYILTGSMPAISLYSNGANWFVF